MPVQATASPPPGPGGQPLSRWNGCTITPTVRLVSRMTTDQVVILVTGDVD